MCIYFDNTYLDCKKSLDKYTRRELCYVLLELIQFYNETITKVTTSNTSIQFKIKRFEIDSEVSYYSNFPIMLSQHYEKDEQHQTEAEKTFLNFIITTENNLIDNIQKVTLLKYLIQSFNLNLESNSLNAILKMINNITTGLKTSLTAIHPIFQSFDTNIKSGIIFKDNHLPFQWPKKEVAKASANIFIQELHASSIQILFSFLNQSKDKLFENMLEDNPMFSKILSFLSNFENLSLNLNGCERNNISGELSAIIWNLINIYKQNALLQIMKIFGNIEILGTPTNLFKSLGTGVKEFFVKPAEGMMKGPLEGMKGLVGGSVSLIRNTFDGTVNTTSKLTSGLSKGLLLITQDDEYINRREKKKMTEKPSTLIEGLGYGITSMAGGIFYGVTDLVRKPIEGAKKNKFVGFGKGLLLGLGGAVAKPVSGILDMVSKTTEGLKNMLNKDEEIKQKRIPRAMYGKLQFIRTYNEFDALVLLYLHKKIEYFKRNNIYYNDAIFYTNKDEETMLLVFGSYEVFLIDYTRYEIKTVLNYNHINNVILKENKLIIEFDKEIFGKKNATIKFKERKKSSRSYKEKDEATKVFELFQGALNEKFMYK